jgi:hypothetical protein
MATSIIALEILSDVLAGIRASAYHYEEAPVVSNEVVYEGDYQFPFAIGYVDGGQYEDGYAEMEFMVYTGVFATRREAEEAAAWATHTCPRGKTYYITGAFTTSGWELLDPYCKLQGWRDVPYERVA